MNQIIKLTELFSAVVAREVGKLERDGIISINAGYDGKVEIHVTSEYFDEHFEGRYTVGLEDWPRQSKRKHSYTTPSGNEIYCIKNAEFRMVS